MYIQLEKQYAIVKPKTNNITIEFNIEEYIKENEIEINDEDDLRIVIQEWIDYDCEEIYYDQKDWYANIIDNSFVETNLVLNMEELIKEYSYLIIPKKVETCCDIAKTYRNRFCPDCGTKLTY